MSRFLLMVMTLLAATSGLAQQVDARSGLKMTIFNPSAAADRVLKQTDFIGRGKQSLKMVVFNHTKSSESQSVVKEVVSETDVKRMPAPVKSITATPMNGHLKISTGYRRDHLKFSIADPTGSPNVLSELDWHHLESQQIEVGYDLSFAGGLYLQASADAAWIWNGRGRDSDWAGDNKTLEFSRSTFDTKGHLFDLSVGLGYSFNLPMNNRLTPLAGYAFNEQRLNVENGNQVLFDRENTAQYVGEDQVEFPLGSFRGLDSDYEARWHGPWLGLRWEYLGTNLEMFVQGEYHWLDYRAEADWNLRQDFQHPVSFVHEADAEGWVAKIGASYRIRDNLSLMLDARYRDWQTDSGSDETFFADGDSGTTTFNEAEWESYGVNFGVNWDY